MLPSSLLKPVEAALFVGLLAYAWSAGRPEHPSSAPGAAKFAFTLHESARARGIDFTHHPVRLDPRLDPILPHVAGMGAAIAIVDADGDGWPDLYATSSAAGTPNALYRNQHDGTFRDVAREAGLADVNVEGEGASMGSVWADYDGDGDLDCFLYKWGYPQLFENQGGLRFRDVTAEAGLRQWKNSNAACWIDYDRDGRLDLYVTGYFRDDVDLWKLATTRIMQESFEFANNGGHNRLYRNLGGGRFEDVTEKTGVDSTRWTLAVAAADFDQDGWQDLYLANDYGPEELFLNRGGERFERATGIGLEESSKSGMAVAVGDFRNAGELGVYVTNISKSGYLFQGNNLRVNRLGEGGKLQNVAAGVVENCGWSWGAQFGDLDNDGWLDLVVVNGFVSANKDRDYWYGMTKVATATGRLAEDASFWPPMEDRSLSGYERSRVLVNQGGKARFVDAAEAVGADDLEDGRGVAFGDLDNRGALDVVIANQKGPLVVYRNEVDPARHWIQLDLRGKGANPCAIGASVTLHAGGRVQTQAVLAGSGFCSQNDLRLHFGLGAATAVDKVVVRWPSGASQELSGLAADRRHRIEER
jgi:hypothetical protein